MPILTSDLLSSTLTGARKIFNDTFPAALENAPWLKMCLDGRAQDSKGKESMQYGWLWDIPKMSRWKGELELGDLVGADFSLKNHLHKAAFGVERLALERDQLDMIGPKTRQLVDEANRFIGESLFDLLNNGGSASLDSPVFDAAAFFGSAREIHDSGTIDNTQGTAGTSAANFRTDLGKATYTMMRYGDTRGRPINKAPNLIVIPPEDLAAAWEGLNIGAGSTEAPVPPMSSDGTIVFTARGYTVVVSAYIDDTGGRYFMHVSPGRAPFLLQQEFQPQIEGITRADSESAVLREEFIYAVRGSFAVGYGDPRLCIYFT